MLKSALLPLMAALAIAAPASAARRSPEAQLAREIEGRVAGAPVRCIDLPRIRNTRIIERTAIVYDAGRTIYVNRPRGGLESLHSDSILITRLPTSQLCNVDVVHLGEPGVHMQTGSVFLGDFVPYTLPKR